VVCIHISGYLLFAVDKLSLDEFMPDHDCAYAWTIASFLLVSDFVTSLTQSVDIILDQLILGYFHLSDLSLILDDVIHLRSLV